MCGIIGYTGSLQATEVILDGLAQLEYRGYDSAGLAALTDDGQVYLQKKAGQVAVLRECCDESISSHCGIGHTRWATHGGVTDTNAHPHVVGQVILLHNGIIENYHAIQTQFDFRNVTSETDTEIAAHLINHFYRINHDPFTAIEKAVRIIEGSYAFCIMFTDLPGKIFSIRQVSPLVAASSDQGAFFSSDVTALLDYTKEYFVLPEQTIAIAEEGGIRLLDLQGNPVRPEMLEISWNVDAAKKGGYPHFMLKEIHEQPEAFLNTISPRLQKDLPDFSLEGIPDEIFASFQRVQVVACGTAMYAGMVGRALFEHELRIPVTVSIASEFRYDPPMIDKNTLTIVVSQSGETIDTLAALRLAKEYGSTVISIVNVKGSTIARESDYVIYTHAGPEIAVASTKAYMVQLSVFYLLTAKTALVRGTKTEAEVREFITSLRQAAEAIESSFALDGVVRKISEHISHCHDAYYIGRGLDYAFSLEGSLKLKEIAYVHAEAYAAGELKHGTIALIEEGVPVVALATQERLFNKTISNVREVKARGAYVILIVKEGAEVPQDSYDILLEVKARDDLFTVFPTVVILQMLAYYTSYIKGYDVDKPRNLAKSVTVE